MKSAAQLREQIKISLSTSAPLAFTPFARSRPKQTPCGISAIDEVLQGGLSAGVLTELVGAACSGRTTTALAYLATITQAGGVCAWIDTADALEPESVAASCVDLERLLWVRCGTGSRQRNDSTLGSLPTASRSIEGGSKSRHTASGSPHHYSEGRDMPEVISALMHAHDGLNDQHCRREKKAIGTPGMPNRFLSERSQEREEQTNSDRLPPRRGDNLSITPRCAEPQPRRALSVHSDKSLPVDVAKSPGKTSDKPWQMLDQALRVTDLLLQSAGFSVIVLDLGSISPEFVSRIPFATWFRFRASCERTRSSLVLLTQHPCAGTSAELVVRLQAGTIEAESKVMTGIRYSATVERSRSHEHKSPVLPIRKPPQRAGQWTSEAAWVRSR